jgi:hypothetical protein
MEIKKDALGNEYYVDNNIVVRKEYADEAYKESVETIKELCKEAGSDDPLDWDLPVGIPLFDGLHSIRNANIKKEKLYLDEEEQTVRYSYKNKDEGNIRNKATIILLRSNDRWLSDIITQLPYGLIDKQATGIGATHLEMISERNSIIVVPTRALGENKCSKDPDKFLYVGTQKRANKVTSDEEIKNYLNNPNIKFKKIVVVADSLKKVIENIQPLGIDVYREYFLMVDEIDTIQYDNHYRPQLSNVIDYYYKFKLQRRALVSATVKEFSHPRLQSEPLTTIKRREPSKRDITLLYTNNINELLKEKIIEISSIHPTDKILIAYNSLTDIQAVITLLPTEIKNQCGILCSETNYTDDRVEQQFRAEITFEDELSHQIVFMTCAYFAGLDIKDRCHLITISSIQYSYTILPINKITQIAGRCRNGVISDTMIYNTYDAPFYIIRAYRDRLIIKADRVVSYLNEANRFKQGDEEISELFDRIENIILEGADEAVFKGKSISLTRKDIDNEFKINYFNIDVLNEQMLTYSKLYSNKTDLCSALRKNHKVAFGERAFEQIVQETSSKISDEVKIERIKKCIEDIVNASPLNDKVLDNKIRQARNLEREYYSRVKDLYKYIDISILNKKLLEICTENIVSYRNFKNAVYFWALEDNHSFKKLIMSDFQIGERYSKDEIKEKLDIRIKDFFLIRRDISRKTLVSFFTSIIDYTYTGGKCLVKGYTPKLLKDLEIIRIPIHARIPAGEPIDKYFKI